MTVQNDYLILTLGPSLVDQQLAEENLLPSDYTQLYTDRFNEENLTDSTSLDFLRQLQSTINVLDCQPVSRNSCEITIVNPPLLMLHCTLHRDQAG